MDRNGALGKRVNLTIPWDEEHRSAFYRMAEELKVKNPALLAREILGEFMTCHFGLDLSKELGILNPIAKSVPHPMFLTHACETYSRTVNISGDTEIGTEVQGTSTGRGHLPLQVKAPRGKHRAGR